MCFTWIFCQLSDTCSSVLPDHHWYRWWCHLCQFVSGACGTILSVVRWHHIINDTGCTRLSVVPAAPVHQWCRFLVIVQILMKFVHIHVSLICFRTQRHHQNPDYSVYSNCLGFYSKSLNIIISGLFLCLTYVFKVFTYFQKFSSSKINDQKHKLLDA